MLRDFKDVLLGDFYWKCFALKEKINHSKVVVVLSGENSEVDRYAIIYLDEFLDRKRANEAIIVELDGNDSIFKSKQFSFSHAVKYLKYPRKKMDRIYRRYRLSRFFKNIVFTYIDKTANNPLGRFIRETEITEKDIVCLALYNFRCVLNKEVD